MIVSEIVGQIIMDLVFYIFLYVIFFICCQQKFKLLSFEMSSKIFHKALLLDVC